MVRDSIEPMVGFQTLTPADVWLTWDDHDAGRGRSASHDVSALIADQHRNPLGRQLAGLALHGLDHRRHRRCALRR